MPAKKRSTAADTPGTTTGAPPDFKEEYSKQAYKLCLLGATDAQLADFFEVAIPTLAGWKSKHSEFSDSIKKGKDFADAAVAQSLYNRAKGMSVTKDKAIKLTEKAPVPDAEGNPTRFTRQTDRVEVVSLTEEIPPDTSAGIFWLKNRQPQEWRDKQEVDHTSKGEKLEGTTIVWGQGKKIRI